MVLLFRTILQDSVSKIRTPERMLQDCSNAHLEKTGDTIFMVKSPMVLPKSAGIRLKSFSWKGVKCFLPKLTLKKMVPISVLARRLPDSGSRIGATARASWSGYGDHAETPGVERSAIAGGTTH